MVGHCEALSGTDGRFPPGTILHQTETSGIREQEKAARSGQVYIVFSEVCTQFRSGPLLYRGCGTQSTIIQTCDRSLLTGIDFL